MGFSAYVYPDPLVNLPEDTTIKFSLVINNEGNGYSNNTGVFTCPSYGYYLFSFFIVPYQGSHANILLMKNGVMYAQAIAEPSYDTQEVTGGNTVILHLSIGDQVWLQTYENDATSLRRTFTTFTGVMVSRM